MTFLTTILSILALPVLVILECAEWKKRQGERTKDL